MYILLFILVFIVAIVVFGLSIVGFLLRAIFGIGRRPSSSRPQNGYGSTSSGQQGYNQNNRNSTDSKENIYSENASERNHKKIFTKDDGEYVDFEEIKNGD